MTQEASSFVYPRCEEMSEAETRHTRACGGVQNVADGVERLLTDTTQDLKNFRKEQSSLRAQINSVLNENHRLTSELGKYKLTMGSSGLDGMHQRLQLTSDALSKAMKQIEMLRKERCSLLSLHECSQRTIESMETELNNYRAQLHKGGEEQLSQNYAQAVKMLESKLSAQQEELRTQAELIKALHEHKQRSGEQIQQLETKLKDKAIDKSVLEEQKTKMDTMERRLLNAQKQAKELEKSLNYTRTLLSESIQREAVAMHKVQDALLLSEAAVREKAEAEKRAETYKEEATQLATNIGSIMDEAAKRVDNEVAQLKTKLTEKDKAIATLRAQLKNDLNKHKSAVQTLEARNNRLEAKLKDSLKQNEKLVSEIEDASKRLNELERLAIDPKKEELRQAKIKKHYDNQMERYLLASTQMKARYKDALEDLKQKFEAEIYRLKNENSELQADNTMLRGGAGDYLR